jgi:hypothetical protein
MANDSVGGVDLQRGGIAAREDRNKLHIGILANGTFHAASEISVTVNTDFDLHKQ